MCKNNGRFYGLNIGVELIASHVNSFAGYSCKEKKQFFVCGCYNYFVTMVKQSFFPSIFQFYYLKWTKRITKNGGGVFFRIY